MDHGVFATIITYKLSAETTEDKRYKR